MLASKIIFNLVYLGSTSPCFYSYYFRVLRYDPRFTGGPLFLASNGWRIGVSDCLEVSFENSELHLPSPLTPPHRAQRPVVGRITALTEEAAMVMMQSLVDALKEWTRRCPEIATPAPLGSDIKSPEVRESLLMLEDDDELPDGDAPVYVDEFIPPNIAF